MRRFALALSAIVVGLVVASCAVGVRQPASAVTTTSATLNGKVLSTTGGPGSWYIEYGLTVARTDKTPTRTIDFVVNESEPVSEPVNALEPATSYHFAVCAEDSENPGEAFCSPDQTFATKPDQDSVVGGGSSDGFSASTVNVFSGPSGENPTGEASATLSSSGEVFVSNSIECLVVNGNTAIYAGALFPNSFGVTHFRSVVVDSGPGSSAPDMVGGANGSSGIPLGCSEGTAAMSPLNGDIVVTDAQPSSTNR